MIRAVQPYRDVPWRAQSESAMTTGNPTAPDPRLVTAEVRVYVAREQDAVFDYFADLRNEPRYNGQVAGITKTSPGPIGADTTFEGSHRGFGRVTWRLSEYERPRHVVIEGLVGQGVYRWTSDFEAAEGGTWMTGRMEWEPPARWRLFRRLLALILKWNARRSFRRFAHVLEQASLTT
jgi:hypothetical protein